MLDQKLKELFGVPCFGNHALTQPVEYLDSLGKEGISIPEICDKCVNREICREISLIEYKNNTLAQK